VQASLPVSTGGGFNSVQFDLAESPQFYRLSD